jgi:hypothetical protein
MTAAAGQEGVQQAAALPALYPRVLGAAWGALDAAVQRAHDAPGDQQGTGTFVITRSPGWLTGLLLTLAGVPQASAGTGVCVLVHQDGATEAWARTFGSRPLQTRQYATSGGLLAEQFGPLEFWFQLTAEGGALRFRQARQFLRLGPVRVPLPAWAAPHIAAREGPGRAAASIPTETGAASGGTETTTETVVAVRMTTPQGTLLFAYAGTVRWTPADAASPETASLESAGQGGRPA